MFKKIFWLIAVLPIAGILISWIAWLLTPLKPLNVAIIDKTVLSKKVQEHISFNWILTNQRFTKKDGKFYNPSMDYFGFFPKADKKYDLRGLERYSFQQLDSMADELDMAYFTDTYGIYNNEWFDYNILEHSSVIYGGMSRQDIYLLAALKKRKKLILTEFNDIATPTIKEIRYEFEELFGIEWTGWASRYFDALDTNINKELPYWLKNGYTIQHGNRWPFKKSGIVFVHEGGQIEILENKTHLQEELPRINSGDTTISRFGVYNNIPFPYWFDIIRVSRDNNILSWYNINVNAEGDSILQKNGIPKHFPAAVERTIDCKFYYFCGDFADNPITQRLSQFKYIGKIKGFFTTSTEGTSKAVFFWRYYIHLISTIMKDNF